MRFLLFEVRVDPKSFPVLTDIKPIFTIASPTVLFLSESWVDSADPEDLVDLGQAVTAAAKEWKDGNP